MKSLFLTVLNMSLTASYTVVAVMVVRLLLRKAPKVFLCPVGDSIFSSPLSLLP